jgi:ABC-2 type transport system ATP-binding protein
MLVGLVEPTSGYAQVSGFPAGHLCAKRDLGYLPEMFRFPGWMTGAELLDFHGRLLDLPRSDRRSRSIEVLELTGLAEAADRKIATYSKGMQQRIGLAQAILGRPKVLFLDEPTSALDPIGRVHVRHLLQRLATEGTTVFLNSHLLTDVEMICERIAIVNSGKVVTMGSMADLAGKTMLHVRVDALPNEFLDELRERFGPVECNNGTPEFRIQLDDDKMVPAVADFVISHGRKLFELRPAKGTLEETFLEIIEKSAKK